MELSEMAVKIRSKMESKKISIEDLAKQAGISHMTIHRYYTMGTMRFKSLKNVCDVLGLEIIIREK